MYNSSDFHMTDNLSIADKAFASHVSLSGYDTLFLSLANLSTKVRPIR